MDTLLVSPVISGDVISEETTGVEALSDDGSVEVECCADVERFVTPTVLVSCSDVLCTVVVVGSVVPSVSCCVTVEGVVAGDSHLSPVYELLHMHTGPFSWL